MNYSITVLAKLSGISTRTLRYYDIIGLLKPKRSADSGMRFYGPAEVDLLQQILFYRELGLSLAAIKGIVNDPAFDPLVALEGHMAELQKHKKRLEALIDTVDGAIVAKREGTVMKDEIKFKALKEKQLADNEAKYGKEVRAKFGDRSVDDANAKYAGMDPAAYARMQAMSAELIRLLLLAMETGDPRSEASKKLVALHKDWLMLFWTEYAPEAHRGLADAYVDDERFRAFYDQYRPGAAIFLREAIRANV